MFGVSDFYTITIKSDNLNQLRYNYLITDDGNMKISNVAINKPTNWAKFSITFSSATSRRNVGVLIGGDVRSEPLGISFDIRNVKIEEGNKASEWSPYITGSNTLSVKPLINKYNKNALVSRTSSIIEGSKISFDTIKRYSIK